MLNQMSLRGRIVLLVVAAVLGIAVMGAMSVAQARRQLTEARQGQLVTAVESAHSIVEGFRGLEKAGKLGTEAAQQAAKDAVAHARYGKDGKEYLYIWALDGVGVMHPIKPEWAGQNMIGKVKDGGGVDVIAALVDGMRQSTDGRAFVPTNFPRPGETKPVPKLQYIMKVDGWNWMVGSGLYTDDLDAMVCASWPSTARWWWRGCW